MPPATLHGVRVITKLYFVIFAAFEESMTLNLAEVIHVHFGRNRKPVYYLIRAVTAVYSNFSSIFNRLGDIGGFTCTETIV